ncbi:uncharacterized protein LOC116207642 [Punica granatum]|uniref:Uncharacterized protein LOC116207642 n=1 Tax=Punica granatum TaxID=22663 RepID=A0A6P8DTG6_PUNGR|nr:uncharacterized protein LOC116207642 [Punica granatum]
MKRPTSSSSSGEEDGDEEWKAAISSVAASADPFAATGTSTTSSSAAANTISNGCALASVPDRSIPRDEDDDPNHHRIKARLPKHYLIKAQKLLDEIVEKNIEMVRAPVDIPDNDDAVPDEGGIRLFKNAPFGIVFDHIDELKGPRKKPRILPGEKIDEKSKKFKRQVESVVVDGFDVISIAKAARERSLARLEAKDARAKAAARREEERVAELKKIRGERWLPSMAKEMQPKPQRK